MAKSLQKKEHTPQQIAANEERFRALVIATSDVIYSLSPDWSTMYPLDGRGFLLDAVEPTTTWKTTNVYADDMVMVNNAINEAIRTKSIFQLEHRVNRADGTPGWTFSRAVPILDDKGEIIEWFGAASDITFRKLAEEALQSTNEELAASNEEYETSNEELIAANDELNSLNERLTKATQKVEDGEAALRLAIEAANFGTWFINSKTREFITNVRLKELYGFLPDEEISIEQSLAQITDEYRDLIAIKLENAITNKEDFDVTYPVIGLHDKRFRWLRAIGNLKADPSGEFSAFTGVLMDVTERRAEEQRKNDFIGMVSHELKTPITSLSAIIQVSHAKLKNSEDKFLATAMAKAEAQVRRMTTMINGFLDISRLESGKIIIKKQVFDIGELMHEVIDEIRLTNRTHELKLNACVNTDIYADRDKISSVISNLVSNAVKYSAESTSVTISCSASENEVTVSVTDEGIGIDTPNKGKIFDRYYRVESSSTLHISGFGIGLYLSAEIVERHGGKIWVESDPGKGSSFHFSLPRKPAV